MRDLQENCEKSRVQYGATVKIAFFVVAFIMMLLVNVPVAHAEEVQNDSANGGRVVPHYNLLEIGGNFTGTQYTLPDGTVVKDAFFFDGQFTYYLQADGTPMKDRLTYHPDGEHIIYLDENGHEAFTNFVYCPSVGYICYFDSNGYLYKDEITFVGDKVYYLDGDGRLKQNGWFQFANGMDYGFANGDGTLNTQGWGYDPYGRVVFYHWNGMVARGLISDGVYCYSMDETDGHYLGQFKAPKKTVSQIADVNADAAIEADVTLTGAGTGYHAKLVIATPTSAVSYGIQYDACAAAPYTGKAMALIENVSSNAAGGQTYVRPQDRELSLGETYHLMLTYNRDGSGAVYLDNEMIGTYYNPNLANQTVYLRVEGSARVDGDQVNASFRNITLKERGEVIKNPGVSVEYKKNPTLQATVHSGKDIDIYGSISGLGAGSDWDNRYDDVSYVVQYY